MVSPGKWPKQWVGRWSAADGKTVTIERGRGRTYMATVRPAVGEPPYTSAGLLGGQTKQIDRLEAACHVDDEGRRYLEIEAGTPDVGPTYRLYAAVEDSAGMLPAPDTTAPESVLLLPNTSIGLYDDWEDDQGVPWAYPLAELRWQGSE